MDCKASIPDLCTLTYFGILSAHLLGELIIHQVGSDPKKIFFFFTKLRFLSPIMMFSISKIHILVIYNVILVFFQSSFWHGVCDCLPSMNKASKMVLGLKPNYQINFAGWLHCRD